MLFYICEYSVVIKLKYRFSPSPPLSPSVVGRGYILTNFWLVEEVNKKVKKKLQNQSL
jgi:hypothetical protein